MLCILINTRTKTIYISSNACKKHLEAIGSNGTFRKYKVIVSKKKSV